jgi:hypothetical protein
MKKYFARAALIPAMCLLAFATSCQLGDAFGPNFKKGGGGGGKNKLLYSDKFCVQFDEVRTSVPFSTEVVSDLFAEQFLASLAAQGLTADDLGLIRMTGGSYALKGNIQGHDWVITSRVDVQRQGGIFPFEPFVNTTTTNLKGLKGKGENADLNQEGVNIIDVALEDLVNGGDPVLLVKMVATEVVPAPSPQDPMIFTWQACIEVQAELVNP